MVILLFRKGRLHGCALSILANDMSSAISIATSMSKRPNRLIPLATWRNNFSPYFGYAFYSSRHTPERPGKTKTSDISSVRQLMSECILNDCKEALADNKAIERRLSAALRRARLDDSRVLVQHSYTGESVRPLDLRSIYCYTGAQLDDMFQIKVERSGSAQSETLESRLSAPSGESGTHHVKEDVTSTLDASMAPSFTSLGSGLFRESYESSLLPERERSANSTWAQQPYSLVQMVRLSYSTSSLSSLLFSSQDSKGSPLPSNQPDGNRPTESQLVAIQVYLTEYAKGFFIKVSDYRPCSVNIEFENNLFQKRKVTRGIGAYIVQLKKYVIFAHLKYINVRMHVIKITIDETEGTVMVRWRVSGLPQGKIFQFWKFLPGRFYKNMNEHSEWFDGLSTFYVGKDGLIHKHKADRVIPDKNLEVKEVNSLPGSIVAGT